MEKIHITESELTGMAGIWREYGGNGGKNLAKYILE
jgi:hypothetical protein